MKKDGKIKGILEWLVRRDCDAKDANRFFNYVLAILIAGSIFSIFIFTNNREAQSLSLFAAGILWLFANETHRRLDKDDLDVREFSFKIWSLIILSITVTTILCLSYAKATVIFVTAAACLVALLANRWRKEKEEHKKKNYYESKYPGFFEKRKK